LGLEEVGLALKKATADEFTGGVVNESQCERLR
jgi:hypothetical protein